MSRLVILTSLNAIEKYQEIRIKNDVVLLVAESIFSRSFTNQPHFIWSTEPLKHISPYAECISNDFLTELFNKHEVILTI
ncbi:MULTISPECIES: hypothetical protein [Acinetobacter]|uniref:Uncharacterized protein n=3 Tax=Acinetobacter TaxID=469 RepID=A0A365PGF8_ACIJU|nr:MULTISPECIES: hypothetical protein [Acinetobacter]USI86027.1 hypothetical protein LZ086_11995 [Acinetobacter johnsonii]ENU84125.1 hypothetical protein F974_00823 [Acinetobacter sp. CIP 102159]ENX25015.1 hypothetical protein F893_00386 [Acinetobacter sp. CIP 102136]ENX64121.1 hypothetical protein F884_01796 [Acinetobacter sp. CIP 102143]EPG35724.1 hypothetical protein F907_03102 [Acinetobacter colistiniresistens]